MVPSRIEYDFLLLFSSYYKKKAYVSFILSLLSIYNVTLLFSSAA